MHEIESLVSNLDAYKSQAHKLEVQANGLLSDVNLNITQAESYLQKAVTGGSPVMTWSPQSPVRTSHGNKSLSFELSSSISTAIGAPIVATGLTTSPDYHGLLHSPHDHDMLEKSKAN